jgi:hypothetical protein
MAQTDILPANTTAATSSAVTVAAGASVNLVAYVATGGVWPQGLRLQITMDSPSTNPDTVIGWLDASDPDTAGRTVQGPGTFNVVRPKCGVSVGAYSEA